jgi:hypothetical protein
LFDRAYTKSTKVYTKTKAVIYTFYTKIYSILKGVVMTEKWQPKGEWDTETAQARAQRMWYLLSIGALPSFRIIAESKDSTYVVNAADEVVIDAEGDATVNS